MFIETTYALATKTSSSNTGALFNSAMDFWDFVLFWISMIVLFAWVFSIIYILWGWVLLILSWWKDDKIKPAINSIRYALIWLAVIVLSIFVFPKIAYLLGLDVSKYSQPEKIFNEIKVIWDKIFKSWNSSYNTNISTWDNSSNLDVDFSDL